MGCCESKNTNSLSKCYKELIIKSVEKGNLQELINYLKQYFKSSKQSENINTLTFKTKDTNFNDINLLGLCLVSGNINMFKYVLKELKADYLQMEKYFESFNYSGLQVICENNYMELFEYYSCPYFLSKNLNGFKYKNEKRTMLSISIENFEKTHGFKEGSILVPSHDNINQYSPIQTACYYGHIGIISYAKKYCESTKSIPAELDLNLCENIYGENCALIACKTGNYSMIKYLHKNTDVDFHVLNKKNENALQILANATKYKKLGEFLQTFKFLIEKIEIDFMYSYQYTLCLLECSKTIEYFIEKLKEKEITITINYFEHGILTEKLNKCCTNVVDSRNNLNVSENFPETNEESNSAGENLDPAFI